MNKHFYLIAVVLVFLCVAGASVSMALETNLNQYVYGVVVDISSDRIVIQEIKDEGDQISQFEIKIGEETLFKKDMAKKDISQGDKVEIEYKETIDGKMAISITDKKLAETEDKTLEKL